MGYDGTQCTLRHAADLFVYIVHNIALYANKFVWNKKKKFLEKARRQQFLMSQQEGKPIKTKSWHLLPKVIPNNKIQNIQTLEAPFRGSLTLFSPLGLGGLSYGRG